MTLTVGGKSPDQRVEEVVWFIVPSDYKETASKGLRNEKIWEPIPLKGSIQQEETRPPTPGIPSARTPPLLYAGEGGVPPSSPVG